MFDKIKLTGFILALFCATAAATTEDEDASKVVVRVDGIAITQDDIRYYINERLAAGTNPEAFKSASGIAQAGENLLSLRRLGKMARDEGFAANAQIEWELALQRERLLYREWVQSLVDKEMEATDWVAAAREEYIANPDKFIRGKDEVRAAHILVSTESRTDEEARMIADDVLMKAKRGDNFFELAAKYSDDKATEKSQGDLGFFSKGRMVEEFEAAAFELTEKSPLSGLVKTQFGYHIIKYIDRRNAKKLTFDEARESIIARLKKDAPKVIRNRLTMDARSVSRDDAVVNEDALKELENEILGKN